MFYRKKPRVWPFVSALAGLLLIQVLFHHVASQRKYLGSGMDWAVVLRPKAIALSFFHHLAGFYNYATARPVAKASPLLTLDLNVNDDKLELLFSDLPGSGDQYVNAFLRWDQKLHDVKIKLRGDNSYHWDSDQKSWRIRFQKESDMRGENIWNVINPRSLSGSQMFLGFHLSERFGVLAPRFGYGRLFINQRFNGVFQVASHLSESFLRRSRKIPGDIYNGETGFMWNDPLRWSKTASFDSADKENRVPLKFFLDAVRDGQPGSTASAAKIRAGLEASADIDTFLRNWAIQMICGSMHQDSSHNQKMYWDPSKGKIEPINWDTWGHGEYYELREDIDSPLTPVHLALLRFPDLLFKKYRYTMEFLSADERERIQEIWIETQASLVRRDIAASPVIDYGYMTTTPFRPLNYPRFGVAREFREVEAFVPRRAAQLRASFDRFVGAWAWRRLPDGRVSGRLALSGAAPIEITDVRVDGRSIPFRLLYLSGKSGVPIRGNRCYPARGIIPGGMWHSSYWAVQLPSEYAIVADAAPGAAIEVFWTNAVTSSTAAARAAIDAAWPPDWEATVKALARRDDQPLSPSEAASVVRMSEEALRDFHAKAPPPALITWGPGVVTIKRDTVIQAGSTLVVNPGTTLRFLDGTLLQCYGKALFNGRADAPIRFLQDAPLDAGSGLLLWGKGAAGSRFSHCDVSGMGRAQNYPVRLTSALNFHHTSDLVLDHIRVSANVLGDDALHVINVSSVVIRNCDFRDIQADAIDLDFVSEAIVENNVFRNIGNDAIDLMGTSVLAAGNSVYKTGDKGISVGERSVCAAVANRFERCNIGIQIKDESRVLKADNVFIESVQQNVDLLHKSQYYRDPRAPEDAVADVDPRKQGEAFLSRLAGWLAPNFDDWDRYESTFRD